MSRNRVASLVIFQMIEGALDVLTNEDPYAGTAETRDEHYAHHRGAQIGTRLDRYPDDEGERAVALLNRFRAMARQEIARDLKAGRIRRR